MREASGLLDPAFHALGVVERGQINDGFTDADVIEVAPSRALVDGRGVELEAREIAMGQFREESDLVGGRPGGDFHR